MLVRAFRQLYTFLWGVALVLLVILALYASLGRQYIGLVERYQQDIFERVEGFTGISMQAASLQGSWAGLSPVIELSDFRLGANAAVRLDHARIEIDVLSSLVTGTPKVRQIQAGTLSVDLEQTADGRWRVPGLVTADAADASPDMLINSVLGVRSAALDLFAINLRYANGNVTHISSRDFSLRSDDKFRRIYAQLNTDSDGDIQMLLEAYGDPRNAEKFSASAYMVIAGSRLSAIAPIFQDSAPLFDSEVSGELWLSWRRGQRISLSGVLNAPELAVGVLWGAEDASLKDVNMRFAGSHRDGFWRVSFTEFDALWRDHRIDLAGISVRHPEQTLWRFNLPQLDVGASNALLTESDILPEHLQQVLIDLAPEGHLNHIQFDLFTGDSGVDNFVLRAEASKLSVQAWQGAPGAEGLSGYLEISPQQGLLMMDSDSLSLSFPHLYDKAFDLNSVKAELRWDYDQERLRLHSGLISAKSNDKPMAAMLRLDLPLHKDAEPDPMMTLVIGAKDIDASQHGLYTPKVLSDGLHNWLEDSIRGGRAKTAGFIYHGSLLAHAEHSPSVQLDLDLADAELHFQADWPSVKAAQASVRIDNAEVIAKSTSATMNGLALGPLAVDVSTSASGHAVLDVATTANPNFEQVKSLLIDTPLHSYVGSTFDSWTGEGDANVNFGLHLQFVGDNTPNVNVDADIDFSVVGLSEYRLALSNVQGHLHYDSTDGLNSRNLTGEVFGRPLSAVISQRDRQVDVDVVTKLAVNDVAQWLQLPVLQFFSGRSDIRLHIQAGGDTPGLSLASDLRGVEISLPQPFYKSPESPSVLAVTLPFGQEEQLLQLTLADQIKLNLGFSDGALFGAHLTLGPTDTKKSVARPLLGQFNVDGRVDFATFEQWRQIADRYIASVPPSGAAMVLAVNDLHIDDVDIFDHLLDDVRITLRENVGRWQLRVDSVQLAGDLTFPRNDSSTISKLVFQKLALPAFEDRVATDVVDVDPRTLMDANVDIQALSVGGRNWGSVGFNLRSDETGAHFSELRGMLRGIALAPSDGESSLHWFRDDNGNQNSRLQGRFAVKDFGAVLAELGYSKVIETKTGDFNVDMHWAGSPNQWNILHSDGDLEFSFNDGRFLKSSDAASGALRVFSVFNMANIVRRLKFDFRDVFSKGIYFDSMRGSLSLHGGMVRLQEPLDIKGPSSRFQMTGNINLNTDVPALRLVATLPVGSNLPWVAALVGGLPAAAGAYVVTKVFEEQVDSFSSAVYDISGTIQQPELTFKKIFDVDSDENF
ncbi:YhdP family protein [Zhongshania sp. BJYM1]|uniref:YhdP family protein n=1 Tax=Zhongshania aquatica TaxID=2965069 RepID=UPI0022B5800A|nr:YhdP family protein [Marortus sp. BJYM1]